jgi:hypothetical protein
MLNQYLGDRRVLRRGNRGFAILISTVWIDSRFQQ